MRPTADQRTVTTDGAMTPIIVRGFNPYAVFRTRVGSCQWAPAAAVRLERGSPEWESDDA